MKKFDALLKQATNAEGVCSRLVDEAAKMRKEYREWLNGKVAVVLETIKEARQLAYTVGIPDESVSVSKIFRISLYSENIWVIDKYKDFNNDYKDPKTGYYKRWCLKDLATDTKLQQLLGYDLISMWDQKGFEKQIEEMVVRLINKRMSTAQANYDQAKADYDRMKEVAG